MKKIIAGFTLATVLTVTSSAWADPDPVTNPVSSANELYNLTWTNVCSTAGDGGSFFPTCASASLFLYDNQFLELRFWNRAGVDATWSDGAVKAIGLGGVPSGVGGTRGTDWDAGFDGLQTEWAPENDIQGPNDGDGWKTNGNGDAFCSDLATSCPGGFTTDWTSITGGGYGVFYWFVGDALSVLDPNVINLQMHVGSGPGGWSTGYLCYSDQSGIVEYDDGSTTWACGDSPGGPQEVVPEPATMTLLATGLIGLASTRRRRKKIV